MGWIEEYHFYASVRMSNLEARQGNYAFSLAERKLFPILAESSILKQNVRGTLRNDDSQFHTDYTIDVYIIPPDALYRLIHEEAERIAISFGRHDLAAQVREIRESPHD